MMPKVTKEGTTNTKLTSRRRVILDPGEALNRANSQSEDMTTVEAGNLILMLLVAAQGTRATAIQQQALEEQQHSTHHHLIATFLPSLCWVHSESFLPLLLSSL